MALLVHLRPTQADDDALVLEGHVLDVEDDQLGAAEGGGEAQQQKAAVSHALGGLA